MFIIFYKYVCLQKKQFKNCLKIKLDLLLKNLKNKNVINYKKITWKILSLKCNDVLRTHNIF